LACKSRLGICIRPEINGALSWGVLEVNNEQLQGILKYISEEGRICPQQNKWHELWEMLPDKQRHANGWNPPLPLILVDWDNSTARQKMMRFKLHIQYAAHKGILDRIEAFIKALKCEEWHTI